MVPIQKSICRLAEEMQKVHVIGKGKSICVLCLGFFIYLFILPMTALSYPLVDYILMYNVKHSLMLTTVGIATTIHAIFQRFLPSDTKMHIT